MPLTIIVIRALCQLVARRKHGRAIRKLYEIAARKLIIIDSENPYHRQDIRQHIQAMYHIWLFKKAANKLAVLIIFLMDFLRKRRNQVKQNFIDTFRTSKHIKNVIVMHHIEIIQRRYTIIHTSIVNCFFLAT